MKSTPHWVGVRKDRCENHDVFQAREEHVTSERFPDYDYVIGPYTSKKKAKDRAAIEKNRTGTFTDPFCNDGKGR